MFVLDTAVITAGVAVHAAIGEAIALYKAYGRIRELENRLSGVEGSSNKLDAKNTELTNEVARLRACS